MVLYVPANAPAGIVTEMVGFQVAELIPLTPEPTSTGADGLR